MTFISNIVQKEMIKYNHIPSPVTFTLTIQSHRKWLVGRRYAWVSGARPHEHKRTSTHFRTTKHNIIHINGPDKSYVHCLRSFLLLRFLYLCILSFDVLSLELKPWEQYADAEALPIHWFHLWNHSLLVAFLQLNLLMPWSMGSGRLV